MRIHQTQNNLYAQLDAIRAAQRADYKREVERVRKGLTESASEARREDVAEVQSRQNEEEAKKRGKPQGREKPVEDEDEQEQEHLSDWA